MGFHRTENWKTSLYEFDMEYRESVWWGSFDLHRLKRGWQNFVGETRRPEYCHRFKSCLGSFGLWHHRLYRSQGIENSLIGQSFQRTCSDSRSAKFAG